MIYDTTTVQRQPVNSVKQIEEALTTCYQDFLKSKFTSKTYKIECQIKDDNTDELITFDVTISRKKS